MIVFYYLVPEATDRKTEVLRVAVAAHGGVVVDQVPAVRAVATVLGSTPKVGVVAETAVAAVVVASGNGRKARGIIGRRRVANRTSVCTVVPARGGGQGLGNVCGVATTLVGTLTAHIIFKLRPIRIARHVPSRRADALHPARVTAAGGGVAHHRLPIVQIAVGAHVAAVVVRIVTVCRRSTHGTAQ